MSRSFATFIGFCAILIWSFFAWLATKSAPMPPFQLTALSFLIAGLLGPLRWLHRPARLSGLRQPRAVWLIGITAFCVYHFAYYFAIQAAPPVEVALIAYSWPLLIVVFSALLPGETLRAHHVIGTALGLFGALLAITQGFQIGLASGLRLGHVVATLCALSWSIYSVITRRWAAVPVDVVSGFCLASGFAGLALHLALETWVPVSSAQWVALVFLGLGPLGIGFYAWDIGCKHGDIMVLGALSYAGPLLSVMVLLTMGAGAFHWSVGAAALSVTLGAVIAAKDMLFRAKPQ